MKAFVYIMISGLLISLFAFRSADKFTFSTEFVTITLDKTGNVISISEKSSGKEYLPAGQSVSLLSLYKDSAYINPSSMEYKEGKNQIILRYPNKSLATIGIKDKGSYLRLELLSLTPRNAVQAIVWGPYPTTIKESIGETICVVHDNTFAVGLQALNINTIEGTPEGNDNAWGSSFIEPLPGQLLPDSVKDQIGKEVEVNVNITGDMPEYVRTYRGNAAIKKKYGSELRLFSRDRRIPRLVKNVYGKNGVNMQMTEPVNADFIGSAIAFFGCPEPKVIDVIETIELNEKLPHPLLNGQWIKRSKNVNDAYLMFEGKDINKGIEYAKNCGFTLIHIGEIFKTWGHFGLTTDRFPGGVKDISKATSAAAANGIAIGAHTLSMFTATDDAYVSPIPSDSLCKMGSTSLSKDIGENDNEIFIESPDYLDKLFSIHTVRIGKELISFREISAGKPWRLLDCKRGQYGTEKKWHTKKSTVDIIINNSYGGFFPNIHLQDAYAKRLAEVCNETGLGLMDFDGMGGESPSGHGAYGVAKFIDLWYKGLNKYVLTCGAGTTHYYWHIYSFMNWGEPWYNALRESQVNYRIENQRFFKRNYMPPMLGWFSFGVDYRPEEIEWIQARSAAYDAGYLFRVDENIEQNGYKNELFTAIKEWQLARKSGAFSKEQIAQFQNPKNEFHIEKIADNKWNLFPVMLHGVFEQKFKRMQTGEPVTNTFTINNMYDKQPLRFYITAEANGSAAQTVSRITLQVNNYQVLEINEPLKEREKVICDGKTVFICDATWNKIKEIKPGEIPQLENGMNEIVLKSIFSGEKSPVLKLEFKTTGKAELVAKK
ncbi:MAG: hypothetical protein QM802_07015 [Agriterribacter sp.]